MVSPKVEFDFNLINPVCEFEKNLSTSDSSLIGLIKPKREVTSDHHLPLTSTPLFFSFKLLLPLILDLVEGEDPSSG